MIYYFINFILLKGGFYMLKKYNIIGIIISIAIIVFGIVFALNLGSYVISESAFTNDISIDIFKQVQNTNANLIKLNNSIHIGLGVLISSIGFLSMNFLIKNNKYSILITYFMKAKSDVVLASLSILVYFLYVNIFTFSYLLVIIPDFIL